MDKKTSKVVDAIRKVASETGTQDKVNLLASELNQRKIFSPRGATWTAKTLGNFLRTHPEARGSDTTTTPGPQPPRSGKSHTTTTDAARPEIPQSVASAPQGSALYGNTTSLLHGAASHSGTTTIPTRQPVNYHEDTTAAPQDEKPCTHTTGVVIPQLDNDTITTLLEMAKWWKEQGRGAQGMTLEPTQRAYFAGGRVNTGIRISKRLMRDALAKAKSKNEIVKTGGGLSPLVEYLFWRYLGFNPQYLSEETDA